MFQSIAHKPATRVVLVALGLTVIAGCGGSLPSNGASVDPINPEQAKQQGQSVSDYYKRNPRTYETKGNGRR